MVLEQVDILGHLIDLLFDLLKLRLQIFEVALELYDLLVALLLLAFDGALALLEHYISIIAQINNAKCKQSTVLIQIDTRVTKQDNVDSLCNINHSYCLYFWAAYVLSIMPIIYLLRLCYRRFRRSNPSNSFRDYISSPFNVPNSYYFSLRLCSFSLIYRYKHSFANFKSALCFSISSMLPLIQFILSSTRPTSFLSPSTSSIIFLRATTFQLCLCCISSIIPRKTQLRWPVLFFSSSIRDLQK